jgi:lipocalin
MSSFQPDLLVTGGPWYEVARTVKTTKRFQSPVAANVTARYDWNEDKTAFSVTNQEVLPWGQTNVARATATPTAREGRFQVHFENVPSTGTYKVVAFAENDGTYRWVLVSNGKKPDAKDYQAWLLSASRNNAKRVQSEAKRYFDNRYKIAGYFKNFKSLFTKTPFIPPQNA